MFSLYVDSSGSGKMRPSVANLYVTGGVIVDSEQVPSIDARVRKMKGSLIPWREPDEWELHAQPIWKYGKFSRRKISLNAEQRREIFDQTVRLICESNLTILVTVIKLEEMSRIYTVPKPIEYSWKFILERFEMFLKKQNIQCGKIFSDASNKGTEKMYRDIVKEIFDYGTEYTNMSRIIHDIEFLKSQQHPLIQLADISAYIIYRHYINRAYAYLIAP